MAYDEYLAERVKRYLTDQHVHYTELKMMGGLCIKVDDKMLCGMIHEKKSATNLLMARIGEDAYEEALSNAECLPMDFTGRPMRGYVFIKPDGYDMDRDLEYWVDQCLAFNPFAKAAKKRKKKT